MAFPVVATSSFSAEVTNTTSHDVIIPTGTASGDRLVAVIAIDGNVTTSGFPSGWSQLATVNSGGGSSHEIWEKIADGGESDFQYTTSGSETTCNKCLRITGAHASTASETTITSATSTNPDPPSLTPSWGAEDTLWIASYAIDGTNTATGYPTNYNDNQDTQASGDSSCSFGVATRELNATSDNPGTFTVAEEQWGAATTAVRTAAAGGGRTTKNTRSHPLGVEAGVNFRVTKT